MNAGKPLGLGRALLVVLPLPPKQLAPNWRSRSHWPKVRALKSYRHEAKVETLKAVGPKSLRLYWTHAVTQATFYFKVNRRRDDDNLSASLKAAWDGIADAGVVINDAGFTHMPPLVFTDKRRPRVELKLLEVPAPLGISTQPRARGEGR